MYHYTESGLKNVWLKNGYVVKNTPYGEAVSIQDVEGLHKLIGTLITQRPKMSGPELRFLRKELGMSQKALASLVGTSEQNVSLWERRGRITQAVDRLVKLVYLESISDKPIVQIKALIDRLNALDADVASSKLKLEKAREWKEAA
jgi:DNA-binding transcriptional regulator YiaG